jgi:hypothetical protein
MRPALLRQESRERVSAVAELPFLEGERAIDRIGIELASFADRAIVSLLESLCRRRASATVAGCCRERDASRERSWIEALFRTRTGDPLLTMEGLRQPVAAGGNGFGLFLRS